MERAVFLSSLKSLPAYSEPLGDDDCVLDGIFEHCSRYNFNRG